MNWVERATELLHDSESIQTEVRVGTGGVVVTNHRLLVFTPDGDGANYRTLDRPNVEGVDIEERGELGYLTQGMKAAFLGVVLVGFGYAFSFDQFAEGLSLDGGVGAAGAVGLGQVLGAIQAAIDALALLDELLLAGGVLSLAFGTVVFGLFIRSRERLLVVSVAGADDVTLPAPEEETPLDRLQAAIGSGASAVAPDDAASPPSPPTEGESGESLESMLDVSSEPSSGEAVDDGAAAGTVRDPDAKSTAETESDSETSTSDSTLDLSDPNDLS